MQWIKNETLTNKVILALSLVIPIAVAALRYIPQPELSIEAQRSLYALPLLNACLNGSAFFLLIAALAAIKRKNVNLHKRLTSLAVVLSALFLVSYVIFHYTTAPTAYGGDGFARPLYYFILITHILLSAVIVPLALLAYAHGFSGRYVQHRKIVKWAFPMWLYVTSTGVIVYLMISPYYPF